MSDSALKHWWAGNSTLPFSEAAEVWNAAKRHTDMEAAEKDATIAGPQRTIAEPNENPHRASHKPAQTAAKTDAGHTETRDPHPPRNVKAGEQCTRNVEVCHNLSRTIEALRASSCALAEGQVPKE